jgi:hypothetical protein
MKVIGRLICSLCVLLLLAAAFGGAGAAAERETASDQGQL